MKARIIYNPISGNKTFRPKLPYVIERLTESGYFTEVCPTQSKFDAIALGRTACEGAVDLIIAAGGDGTLNGVVNGMMQSKRKTRLGLIPAGTVNDFAQALRIPRNIKQCMDIIISTKPVELDIGKVNNGFFVYTVAAGAFSTIPYATPTKLKTVLGKAAYLVSSIDGWGKIDKPMHLDLTVDGKEYSGEYVIMLAVNSEGFAGFKNIVRDVKLNDGKFEIILIPKSSIEVWAGALRGMIKGLDEKALERKIVLHRASRAQFRLNVKTSWCVDGERGPEGDISIECINKAISIHAAESAVNKLF